MFRLLVAAAVVGSVVVTGVGAGVDAASNKPCGGSTSDAGNGWIASTPPFTVSPKTVTHLAVTPYRPDEEWVTNGRQVFETVDAGCTWKAIAIPVESHVGLLPSPVDGVVTLPTTAYVAAIAAPSSATITNTVYIGINNVSSAPSVPIIGTHEARTRPVVIYNTGHGWQTSRGLPDFGTLAELAASATTPNVAYSIIDPQQGLSSQGGGLYLTANSGAVWQQRDASVTSSDAQGLMVDPLVMTYLYGYRTGAGVVVSRTGGQSGFSTLYGAPGITSLSEASLGGSVELAAGFGNSHRVDLSTDAGFDWLKLPAPTPATDVAAQPLLSDVAVGDGNHVWVENPTKASAGFKARKYGRNVSPTSLGALQLQFTAPTRIGYALVGVHGGQVLRRTFKLNGSVIPGNGLTPIRLLGGGAPQQLPSILTPGASTVRLKPGRHVDLPYRLLLPRTLSPVDLMFLIDTTDSTEHTIKGLRQGLGEIVNELGTGGYNVQFGLADFKDYSSTTDDRGDGDIGDYPYRLDRRIGPVDAALQKALNSLRASGGGDAPEADLTALYQSTTGAGQRFLNWPTRQRHHKSLWIPHLRPGDEAGYRSGALKLAVLATDDRFHRHKDDGLTPEWQTVIDALNSAAIHPISLAVQTIDAQTQKPVGFHSMTDESTLEQDTHTFAPRGGIDCNGDFVPDVRQGSPFVCKLPAILQRQGIGQQVGVQKATLAPTKLAPAIISAIEAIPDLQPVQLGFTGTPGIARVVKPTSTPVVNVKTDNRLNYVVRYTCPASHQPRVYPVGVDAQVNGRVLASAAANVACGAVPVPRHRVPPIVAAAVVPLAAAPAAAAPAPPNPPPNPTNPNPALNPNMGFASQEEEQRQLAFAGADAPSEAEDTELAMSKLEIGAALLMFGGACWAARRRFSAAWHRN